MDWEIYFQTEVVILGWSDQGVLSEVYPFKHLPNLIIQVVGNGGRFKEYRGIQRLSTWADRVCTEMYGADKMNKLCGDMEQNSEGEICTAMVDLITEGLRKGLKGFRKFRILSKD